MALVQGPDKDLDLNRLFEELVEEHQTRLLRVCYLYLKDEAQAKDAVQETFLKAYKGLSSFKGESQLSTWLHRIAINVCRDMQKTPWFRYTDRFITPEMLPEVVHEPDEKEENLLVAVMNLPRKLREVVLLYYYQNYDTATTADILGLARSSVSSRLQRARLKLKEALERMDLHEN